MALLGQRPRRASRARRRPAIAYDLLYSDINERVAPSRPEAGLVGVAGFEPATSSLSGMRSNQLSYTPRARRRCRGRMVELIGVEPTTS